MAEADRLPWAEITTEGGTDSWETRALVRGKHVVEIDERREPYGNDEAPTPGDYLMVATAGCQVEVLKMCLEKARVEDYSIHMTVERDYRPDDLEAVEPYPDHVSLRYSDLNMELTVETTPEFEDRVRRCLDVCEDACIVSRSVEAGIPINLEKQLRIG